MLLPHCSLVPPPSPPPCPPPWPTPPTPPPHLVTSQIRPIVGFLQERKRWNQRTPCCSHTALWCAPPHLPNQTNCLVFKGAQKVKPVHPTLLVPPPLPTPPTPPPHPPRHQPNQTRTALSGTTPPHQAYPGVRHPLHSLPPWYYFPLHAPKQQLALPASTPSPTLVWSPPISPSRPPPWPTPHTSQGKKGSVVGGCCSHCSLAPPPTPPTPPTRLCPPARPPAHPSAQIQKHPCLPFLGGYSQHSQSPNGWNRCALRCFRTALKSFPETCQPQENPLGPAKSTLCLKHLQCRQTSPPPFLGGRRHGVSP